MGRRQLIRRAGALLKQAASAEGTTAGSTPAPTFPLFDLQRSLARSERCLSTLARCLPSAGMVNMPPPCSPQWPTCWCWAQYTNRTVRPGAPGYLDGSLLFLALCGGTRGRHFVSRPRKPGSRKLSKISDACSRGASLQGTMHTSCF